MALEVNLFVGLPRALFRYGNRVLSRIEELVVAAFYVRSDRAEAGADSRSRSRKTESIFQSAFDMFISHSSLRVCSCCFV